MKKEELKTMRKLAGLKEGFEPDLSDAAHEIKRIREEIADLVDEALSLLPTDDNIKERARQYWYGHIMSAVGDSNYPTHSITMKTTMSELEELEYSEEEGDEDDEDWDAEEYRRN